VSVRQYEQITYFFDTLSWLAKPIGVQPHSS